MTLDDSAIARALACSVTTPGLESILVFDAAPQRLRAISATLTRFFVAASGHAMRTISIGPTTTDDALWGAYRLDERGRWAWEAGLVAPGSSPAVITIRNLANLGVDAQRSCVALVGADSAHLERFGQSRAWAPTTLWLASCARNDVGKVSPHLLDRFAIRIDGAGPALAMTRGRLRADVEESLGDTELELDHDISIATLVAARGRRPEIEGAALDRVLDYFADPSATTRRAIALGRLALAHAKLADAKFVTRGHVDDAAAMIGLRLSSSKQVPATDGRPTTSAAPVEPKGRGRYVPPPEDETVHVESTATVLAANPVAVVALPYEEDSAPVEREQRSLALPIVQQRATVRATRGTAIGVTRTHELHDLAITATMLEAAKHRQIRKARSIRVTPADLHRYRRVAPVEHLLAIVLDYTSLDGWDWGAAVLPYLRMAYTQRAAVCLVQVGAKLEPEVRARRSISRSILAAPIAEVFAAERGTATPLAHGLDLAFETLRHALQHGRGVAVRAQLVVVTDGRGNVPLEASRRGEVRGRVRNEGVLDAITVAEKIRMVDRLQSVVIQPPPSFSADLPIRIAVAMGAERRVCVAEKVDDE